MLTVFHVKSLTFGAGEIVWWLRELKAHPEDLSSVSSIHIRQLRIPVTLVPRDPTSSSGLQGNYDMHIIHLKKIPLSPQA